LSFIRKPLNSSCARFTMICCILKWRLCFWCVSQQVGQARVVLRVPVSPENLLGRFPAAKLGDRHHINAFPQQVGCETVATGMLR
jgi:hypothetical protein